MTTGARHELRPAGRDDEWLDKWAPPCPDGNPQRVLEILGFRLKGADYLQIRVVLCEFDPGVCAIVTDERPDRIYVRAIACVPEDAWRPPDELEVGYKIWLDAPLGERIVIDVDTDEELPMFVPRFAPEDRSFYMPRPPGLLWPPEDVKELF